MSFFTQSPTVFRGPNPLNAFTPRAQQTVALARRVAVKHSVEGVDTEHLLAGLLQLNQGIGVRALEKAGVDPQELKSALERSMSKGTTPIDAKKFPYLDAVKRCLALAGKEAEKMGNAYCGTEHVLLGILSYGQGKAADALNSRDFNLERARAAIRTVQGDTKINPNESPKPASANGPSSPGTIDKMSDSIPPLPGHVRKVTIAYGGSLAVVALGVLVAMAGERNSSLLITGVGLSLAGVGAVACVRAFKIVQKAPCPQCETEMRQGFKGNDSDGIFTCSKCGSKWKAAIRWNV